MQIYLPIAEVSVNAFLLLGLGGMVGVLSGMFGVGGGFLTTPLLIFYGIPPTVAAASASTQVTGASVSDCLNHWQRGNVDMKMGLILLAGGTRVIDLAADFRIKDQAVWEHWYGMEHACPELVDEAVYGLLDPRFRDRVQAGRGRIEQKDGRLSCFLVQ